MTALLTASTDYFNFFNAEHRRIGRKEMFYLTTHSTHFIYGYMTLNNIVINCFICVGNIFLKIKTRDSVTEFDLRSAVHNAGAFSIELPMDL